MSRQISSQLTNIYRIGTFVSAAAGVIFLIFVGFVSRKADIGEMAFFGIFVFIAAGLSIWFALRLRDVSIDDNYLYVSNFNSGQRISLAEISDVTENFWLKYHPITIHLRSGTPTAAKIVFLPTWRWFTAWRGHPVVDELKELARKKQITG
ncbi:MAG: hypothetical protein ABI999_12310 [Acidobacteriota bacterium]